MGDETTLRESKTPPNERTKRNTVRVETISPPCLPVPPRAYRGTETAPEPVGQRLAAAGCDLLLCATADSTCPLGQDRDFDQARRDETTGMATPPGATAELHHLIAAHDAVADSDIRTRHHTLVGPALRRPAARLPPVVVPAIETAPRRPWGPCTGP